MTNNITTNFQLRKANISGPPKRTKKGPSTRTMRGESKNKNGKLPNYKIVKKPTTGIIATSQIASPSVPNTNPKTDKTITEIEMTGIPIKASTKWGMKFQMSWNGNCKSQNGNNKILAGIPNGHKK